MVDHRKPIPEILVKPMSALAWNRGWCSWCGVTLVAFYGAGRLGEILCCTREDLLLPRDLGDDSKQLFLRLRKFKSLFRQPARVQHMKVTDTEAVFLIDMIFESLQHEQLLFPASAFQYRKLWGLLLGEVAGYA